VPSRSAQEVTDRLAKMNIKGILNFTPVRIAVPDHIRVQTIDLSVELQTLIYQIKQQ
jgi:redox-sensing transcriptional repressor